MTTHVKNASHAEWIIADPGDAAALPNDQSGTCSITTSSSGETNTLAIPVRVGQQLTLNLAVDGGGDRVVTVASAYDELGSVTITLGEAGGFVTLQSIMTAASTFAWRVVAYDNVTGPSQTFATLTVGTQLLVADGKSAFIGPAAVPASAAGGNWLGIEDFGTPPSGTLTNAVAIYAESAGDDLDVLHADGTTDALLT